MKYEVWTEGYRATGEGSGATFHGTFEGETFRDACAAWAATLTDPHSKACVDLNRMNFWGCRFFDNRGDASRSFGPPDSGGYSVAEQEAKDEDPFRMYTKDEVDAKVAAALEAKRKKEAP